MIPMILKTHKWNQNFLPKLSKINKILLIFDDFGKTIIRFSSKFESFEVHLWFFFKSWETDKPMQKW